MSLMMGREERPPAAVSVWLRLKFGLVRGFLWAWARCFSLTGLYQLGQVFGTCEYLINYKRRARFRGRLREIFGEDISRREIRRHTLRFFTRTRCDKLFYLIFDKLPREKILRRIKFPGKEMVERELGREKGAYIAMSHNGAHHVAWLLCALMGYKLAGVRDRNEGASRRYIQERYAETFPELRRVRMLYSDAFPRELFRCLRDGYMLASALDVDRDRGEHLRTLPVRMFGRERRFLTGTMQIALRCGSPILQAFVVSRKNFYFRLEVVGPLVDPEHVADEPALLGEVMQRYADNIEAHVRAHPCHLSGF